ncbi:hypothetical protein KC906_00550 [Candidatus Kaiserbacteria bacterium]|nr:hypothetical protein [Candidatus Kaiserbacteria bacterium]MCB9812665.1 hypothetical protein [Candidatus Nomurabacteria bacterium]
MHFNDERFKQSMAEFGISIGNIFCRNWLGSWDEALYDPPRGVSFYMPYQVRHEGFGNFLGSVHAWNEYQPKNLIGDAWKILLLFRVVSMLILKSIGVVCKLVIVIAMTPAWILTAIGKSIQHDEPASASAAQTHT